VNNACTTYELTAKFREHYAKQLFDLKHVRQARDPRRRRLSRPPTGSGASVRPSRSVSARKLETWLEENQYRYAWSPTRSTSTRSAPTVRRLSRTGRLLVSALVLLLLLPVILGSLRIALTLAGWLCCGW
jgi:hypothetical protein